MLSSYRAFLSVPGAPRLLIGGLVGRLPQGMLPLAFLLLVHDETGSFAAAGLVVAAFSIPMAALAPVHGTLVDRFGQSRLLLPSAFGYSLFLAVFALEGTAGAPLSTLAVTAALAGSVRPPIAACARVLWREISSHGATREAAYAVDATAQETVFITGPLIVGLVSTLASPAMAILLAAGVGLVGTTVFATSRHARAWRGEDQPRSRALRSVNLRAFLVSSIFTGCGWGGIQVGLPALAVDVGGREVAGVFLSLVGLGSIAGGLTYGALRWRGHVATRYATLLMLVGLSVVPLMVVQSLAFALFLSLMAGLPWAPVGACQYTIIGGLAPRGAMTEAFTWHNAAFAGGVAGGSALAGWLVEAGGARAGFVVAAILPGVAGVWALVRSSRLRWVEVTGTETAGRG